MPIDRDKKKLLGSYVKNDIYEDFSKIADYEQRTIANKLSIIVEEYIKEYKIKFPNIFKD